MKPVLMKHKDSKEPILVQAGQVGNMKHKGWVVCDEKPKTKEVKQNANT